MWGIAFGLWLVDLPGRSRDETGSYFALALGRPRQARFLAGRLAQNDDVVSHELRRLPEDRASAVANYAAVAAVVAILALMVWQSS